MRDSPCSALCPFTACHACAWRAMEPEHRQDALEALVDDLFKMPDQKERDG